MENERETIDTGILKRRLNHELESIKVMLVHKKGSLPIEEWYQFVETTRQRILLHPDQYLEKDFPSKEILESTVNKIFEDFLNSSQRIASSAFNTGSLS
jgi:hypothetical protein